MDAAPDDTDEAGSGQSVGRNDVNILLVEDNAIDARATIKAAEKLRISNKIDHVLDGDEALRHLRERTSDQLPDLVLLDLNLPGTDGHDVLREMRADARLRRIPVVVLTTSDDDADILASYELGANAFVTKPVGMQAWVDLASAIDGFWFSLVRLPPR